MDSIPGWLTPHEGQFLYRAALYVRPITGVIVEIGSYLGKSTVYLAGARNMVYAIDPHKGEFSGGKSKSTKSQFLKNITSSGVSRFIHPIIQTSERAHRSWKHPVKMLFIDGLHDELHAREDYTLWSPHLVNGGIVAMHDAFCGWEGAGRVAMRYIVYNPEYTEIGVIGSIIYGIKSNPTVISWIIKLFRQCIIELCQSIYNFSILPKWVQFILVHRLLRICLLNRFSTFGNPSGKDAIGK